MKGRSRQSDKTAERNRCQIKDKRVKAQRESVDSCPPESYDEADTGWKTKNKRKIVKEADAQHASMRKADKSSQGLEY